MSEKPPVRPQNEELPNDQVEGVTPETPYIEWGQYPSRSLESVPEESREKSTAGEGENFALESVDIEADREKMQKQQEALDAVAKRLEKFKKEPASSLEEVKTPESRPDEEEIPSKEDELHEEQEKAHEKIKEEHEKPAFETEHKLARKEAGAKQAKNKESKIDRAKKALGGEDHSHDDHSNGHGHSDWMNTWWGKTFAIYPLAYVILPALDFAKKTFSEFQSVINDLSKGFGGKGGGGGGGSHGGAGHGDGHGGGGHH